MKSPRIKALLVLACIVSITHPLHSQETAAKIDSVLGLCVETCDGSTASVRNCYGMALKKMDARLNQVYKTLMGALSEEQKIVLRDAQRKWLAFREAELALSAAVDPNSGGTLALINADACAYELLKDRVRALEAYLAQLNM